VKSVLIVKLAALGDIAVASATARAIRARHPNARITWLTGETGAHLVRLFPEVDEVIPVNDAALFRGNGFAKAAALARTWMRVFGRRFDVELLMHADRRYRLLTLPVRATRRIRFEHGAIPLLDRDRASEYVRLFTQSYDNSGVELCDIRSRLGPTRDRRDRRRIVVVPGGARNILRDDGVRRWPIENYRDLTRRLLEADCEVVLIGDADDAYVRPYFSDLRVVDRIGQQSLREALMTLRDADLIITHDTGPLHFARLVKTPAIGIFGPTDPRHVVGSAGEVIALWGGEELPCRPCYDGRDFPPCQINVACMRATGVERVWNVARERLGTLVE